MIFFFFFFFLHHYFEAALVYVDCRSLAMTLGYIVAFIAVTLSGNDGRQFRGFLIQARIIADDTTYAGSFGVADSVNSQLSPCSRNTVSQLIS